jgi:hypothetical protein
MSERNGIFFVNMKHCVINGVQYLFGGKFFVYVGTKGIATKGFCGGNSLRRNPTKMCVGGFRSWFPYEQIEVRECLLSIGAEPVVFQVAIQKLKDQDI